MAPIHVSSFSWEDDSSYCHPELNLSPETSVWLHVCHFWSRVYSISGIPFGEYEDDVAQGETLEVIKGCLVEEIEKLDKSEDENIEFVYAWNDKGEKFKAKISIIYLRAELNLLLSLVSNAISSNRGLFCSL